MLYTHVEGGTGAGVRTVAEAYPHQWQCRSCNFNNERYFRNCFRCYAPRPNYH